MKQTNIFDFLGDHLESLKQEVHAELEREHQEAKAAAAKAEYQFETPETVNIPKVQAIKLSIEDIILNTLQGKEDITADTTQVMLQLAELRTKILRG